MRWPRWFLMWLVIQALAIVVVLVVKHVDVGAAVASMMYHHAAVVHTPL